MIHYAAAGFWRCYHALPSAVRELADKQFELLKANPRHPSLHYKVVWWWVGTHAEYDQLVG